MAEPALIESDDDTERLSRKEQTRLFSNFRRKTMVNLLRTWRELKGNARLALTNKVDPSLPREDFDHIRKMMRACIDPRGGDVSARANTVELGRTYLTLTDAGRNRFLKILAEDFGPDETAIRKAAEAFLKAKSNTDQLKARADIAQSVESRRMTILRQFNGLPDGFKFLVDMRGDVIQQLKKPDPWMDDLAWDLKTILSSWFDIGLLDLTEINWNSPAAILEKLIAYEAVHKIKSWNDLKNRLDSDRRCYAFFHNKMPQEPLIFVQVALVEGMSGSVQDILDEEKPVILPEDADTAIFYSISNAQKGLAGISFGNFLIKRVVEVLSRELPHIKMFATLSPIPAFRRWLDPQLKEGRESLFVKGEAEIIRSLGSEKNAAKGLLALLNTNWWQDVKTAERLKPILMRLCAHYLIREKRNGKALDPVAHFHLTNGARMERLNWLGDTSDKGLSQAAGMMVNYNYRLDKIDDNHEEYVTKGIIAASKGIKGVL